MTIVRQEFATAWPSEVGGRTGKYNEVHDVPNKARHACERPRVVRTVCPRRLDVRCVMLADGAPNRVLSYEL